VLQLECPACHAKCEIAPDLAGSSIACPRCGSTIAIPQGAAAITAASPTPQPSLPTSVADPDVARRVAGSTRLPEPQIAKEPAASNGTWMLIIGLLLGAGLLAFMTWDSLKNAKDDRRRHSDRVVILTDENWQKEVIDSDVPVLVDFYADWCQPCRMMAPTIEKLAEQYQGKVKFGKLNVDEATKVAAMYKVSSLPTVQVFKGGRSQVKLVGLREEEEFVKVLDEVIQ